MNKELRDTLLQRMKADQEMRFSGKWHANIDIRNTIWLRKIIKRFGWPDTKLVGKKGSQAAWILAQHADHDLDFQKACLILLTEKYSLGLIEGKYFALLTDRVRVNSGLKQIYGTQFHRHKDDLQYPRPILNIKKLRILRKKMGLVAFKDDWKKNSSPRCSF